MLRRTRKQKNGNPQTQAPDSGLYVIWLRLDAPCREKVGALGDIAFAAGLYAYIGSAQRNREARVRRHLQRAKPLHWHFDYLRPYGTVVGISLADGPRQAECRLVRHLQQTSAATIAYPRFGATDCRCPGHLLYWPDPEGWPDIAARAGLHSIELK